MYDCMGSAFFAMHVCYALAAIIVSHFSSHAILIIHTQTVAMMEMIYQNEFS